MRASTELAPGGVCISGNTAVIDGAAPGAGIGAAGASLSGRSNWSMRSSRPSRACCMVSSISDTCASLRR